MFFLFDVHLMTHISCQHHHQPIFQRSMSFWRGHVSSTVIIRIGANINAATIIDSSHKNVLKALYKWNYIVLYDSNFRLIINISIIDIKEYNQIIYTSIWKARFVSSRLLNLVIFASPPGANSSILLDQLPGTSLLEDTCCVSVNEKIMMSILILSCRGSKLNAATYFIIILVMNK